MNLQYDTDRLILKVLHENDANKVLNFYIENERFFSPYEPLKLDNFYTIEFQRKALFFEYQQMLQGKSIRFYIFHKQNLSKIIGSVNFNNIIRGAFLSCQIGYKFDHSYQKKGYAKESIQKCIHIMFQDCSLHRIEAMIMPTNRNSIHLAEKLGFHYEGLSSSYANINGIWQDHARYALINYSR